MIKMPFCYKVWGLAQDEKGNKDYAYIKMGFEVENIPDIETYEKLHKHLASKTGFEEDIVKLISVEEYIENIECEENELKELKEFIALQNKQVQEHK